MKKCPLCFSVYTNDSYNFCLDDGTSLVADSSTKYDPNAPTLIFDAREEPIASLPKVVKRQFYEEHGKSKTEIAYPQLQGLSREYIQRRINSFLRRKFLGLDDKPPYVEEDERDEVTEENSTAYGVTLLTQNTLSVRLWTTSDFGGAHPVHGLGAFNIDLESGYLYTFDDLFRLDSDYKNIIPELATTSLQKQAQKQGYKYFPFEPREVFDFYLTRKNLVLINLYWVHAAQGIEVPIKYSEISELIHPEGPLFALTEE